MAPPWKVSVVEIHMALHQSRQSPEMTEQVPKTKFFDQVRPPPTAVVVDVAAADKTSHAEARLAKPSQASQSREGLTNGIGYFCDQAQGAPDHKTSNIR